MKLNLLIKDKEKIKFEDLEDLGWTEMKFNNEFNKQIRHFARHYEKKDSNFAITLRLVDSHINPITFIEVMAKDCIKLTWTNNPELFRVVIPCPTKEVFEFIMDLLNV